MNESDFLNHWAMIARDIKIAQREAKESILKSHSISKKAFDELEEQASCLMGADSVETEYGKVVKAVGKINFRPLSPGMKRGRQRLTLITKE